MKRISRFYIKESGFFIDLEGAPVAYSITPNEGDVLINYGMMRACIPGVNVVRFATEERESLTLVLIYFKSGIKSDNEHIVGIMPNGDLMAQQWIDQVNKLYK